MVEWAMKVKNTLELFVMANSDREKSLSADWLSRENWEELTHVLALLKPFHDLVLRMEGKAKDGAHGSIWEILPAIEILLQHLETAKVEFEHSDYKHITISINNAWKKLNKYYKLTNMSPIYVAAIVLNL